jgi:subtilisin family serine protease
VTAPSIDSATADQLTASILARRAGKPGAVQFEAVTDTGGHSTHVVSGELLIRTADYAANADAFAGWTTKAYLDGLLTRLTAPANRPALKPLLDGIPAVQPNAVVPSGAADPTIVWKRATPPTPPPAIPVVPPPAAVGPRVAVLDTGIPDANRTDPALAGLQRADNRDPLDAFPGQGNGFLDAAAGHGAFVTGILRSSAPFAAIDVRKVLDSEGIGSELDLAVALLAAVRTGGARVVNLSLGLETYGDRRPLALTVALELIAASGSDVVIVAAAGNSGQKRRVWPAAFDLAAPRVIAVGALTRANEPAPWSSFGDWVDCSAVGEKVVSTYVTGTQDAGIVTNPATFSGPNPRASWTGTSFAAPWVAGQIAAIMHDTGLAPWDAFKQLVDGKKLRPGHGYLLT